MIRPTPRLTLILASGIPVALLPVLVDGRLWTAWLVSVGAALMAAGLDALLTPSARRLILAVDLPDMLYIGEGSHVTLTLSGLRSRRPVVVEVRCDLSQDLEPQPPRFLWLNDQGQVEIPLVARRRGSVWLHRVWARWTGPLGLMYQVRCVDFDLSLPVVPNIKAVRSAALRFFSNKDFLSGLKVEHYLGDGSEFDSLREFQPGFDHRAIDWKASARHSKLLCRDYRAERNHRVVLAFDTGHLMSESLDGIPRLDHAINAGLLLGYVCLHTGDRVGIFSFDREVRGYLEPQAGTAAMGRLQEHSASLNYSNEETNFSLALTDLSMRLKRRSLVIVLTDFVDTISANLMLENLNRMARRHVIVFVSLRDPTLEELALAKPSDLDRLHRAMVARDMIRERYGLLARLRREGVHCVDARPRDISTNLISRYLDIKRRELVS